MTLRSTAPMDGLIYDGFSAYATASDGGWGWRRPLHSDCKTDAEVVTCQRDGARDWGL